MRPHRPSAFLFVVTGLCRGVVDLQFDYLSRGADIRRVSVPRLFIRALRASLTRRPWAVRTRA